MMRSEAHVATATPRRYVSQLCKHFGHKVPATFDERQGRIEFPFGLGEIETMGEDALILRVSAEDEERLTRAEQVLGGHLERFAFREALQLRWTRG